MDIILYNKNYSLILKWIHIMWINDWSILPSRRDALVVLLWWLLSDTTVANNNPIISWSRKVERDKNGKFYLGDGKIEWKDGKYAIASLTKLMTALICYEFLWWKYGKSEFSTDSVITVRESDKKNSTLSQDSSYKVWERYTVDDLIHGMLIQSTNECAEVLARTLWGNRDRFIEQMNKRAKSLGMNATFFNDPSWLSYDNVSSVHDLEKLVLEILNSNYPIGKISIKKSTQIKGKEKKSANLWMLEELIENNHTPVLSKTWFNNKARRCEILIIKSKDGGIYIVTVLNSPDITTRRERIRRRIMDNLRGK